RAESVFEVLLHHRRTAPTPLNEVRPDVPAGLAAVAAKMMAKAPADRFPTPRGVADALVPFFRNPAGGVAEVFRSAATSIEPAAAPPPAPAHRRPRWGIPVLAAALALAGLIGMWVGGVFRVQTPAGVLVVAVDEEGAEVVIDGQTVTV